MVFKDGATLDDFFRNLSIKNVINFFVFQQIDNIFYLNCNFKKKTTKMSLEYL